MKTYYWKIVASNDYGETESLAQGRRFTVDFGLSKFDEKFFRAGLSTPIETTVIDVEDEKCNVIKDWTKVVKKPMVATLLTNKLDYTIYVK